MTKPWRDIHGFDSERPARLLHHLLDSGNDIVHRYIAHALAIELAGVPTPAWCAGESRVQVEIADIAGLPRRFAPAIDDDCGAFDRPCEMHQESDRPDVKPSVVQDRA